MCILTEFGKEAFCTKCFNPNIHTDFTEVPQGSSSTFSTISLYDFGKTLPTSEVKIIAFHTDDKATTLTTCRNSTNKKEGSWQPCLRVVDLSLQLDGEPLENHQIDHRPNLFNQPRIYSYLNVISFLLPWV